MKNVFITGSSGFLGKNLVKELSKEKNINIYCLIRDKKKKFLFQNLDNVKMIFGDVNNPDIDKKLPNKIGTIFHLAGIIGNADYEKNYKINVLGTRNIVRIAEKKNINKLIHISSINVDFKKGGAYSKTKKLAEKEVKKSKIPSIILRPSQIYGEGDNGFRKIAKYVKKGAVIPIIGKGDKFEQPIFVKELVELMILFYKRKKIKGHEIFYAAGKDKITFNDLISYFEKHYKKNKIHIHIPKFIALSISKILCFFMRNPPITNEQVYQIDKNTDVDMSKTWKNFKYENYDLDKTLKKLLEKGAYDEKIAYDENRLTNKGFKYFINDKIQKLRIFRNLVLKRPILVIFDITKRCNQRCNTCNIWKKGDIKNEMGLKEIKKQLDILKKFGVGYAFVQGGDPLMRKDIKEIVVACLERHIKPTIITNGIALTPDLFSFFSNHNCNLAISLDTLNREIYRKIRGVDSLKRVLKNIEIAKDYKRKGNWSVTTTITQINYKDVWKLKKYVEKRGFMHAIRPYIYHLGEAGKADDNLIYKNKEKITELFNKMAKETEKDNYLASLVYREHVNYLKKGNIGRCDALERSFLMQEDGACSPCVEYPNLVFNKKGNFEKNFKRSRKRLNLEIIKCSQDTPCFYNDAREIGVLWNSKIKILFHLPKILISFIKYGNFF